ncbi:hypothetical protein QFC22_000506 [Naganishia vaughanmartiniae]|uniref:Uncharacterized protein n=1 Tax=Naganishia vaughanmartiniae TaxID=1424756 RepID=A0ACC2XN97_9TREE|nr:hypothetical protein QFC22_000506 [Naganishia vaughanmartiniae]
MPSHESQLAAVAIASAVFGYWLATALRLPSVSEVESANVKPKQTPATVSAPTPSEPSQQSKKKNKQKQKSVPVPIAAEEEGEIDTGSDSENEKEAINQASLDQVKAGKWEECKLVLVVNQELGMTKGKIAAQCGHATLACYKTLLSQNPKLLNHWEQTGQAKVAVKCTSTAELLKLQSEARALNLCARSIQDA